MSEIVIGILSGGAGTRLWPLSREKFPKQFHDVLDVGSSLFLQTVRRVRNQGPLVVVTTRGLKDLTLSSLKREGVSAGLLLEPTGKNTAPAVAWLTWHVVQQNPKALVAVFPADHWIENTKVFDQALHSALNSARAGEVCTLGIEPTYAATAYGYMTLQEKVVSYYGDHAQPVQSFVEKPKENVARELIQTGRAVWNAGMFVFRADVMAAAFEKHQPQLWKTIQSVSPQESSVDSAYAALPSLAFDVAIMEKLDRVMCVPVNMGWTDVGSWEEVVRLRDSKSLDSQREHAAHGNAVVSLMPQKKKVAFVGVDNVVVVDTPDAMLVMKKGSGQELKSVVESLRLSPQEKDLAVKHTFEERPWGRFEVLLDTANFKSKRIQVWPQQILSYQSHAKRAEHWVITQGEAEVTLNDKKIRLGVGESVHIPLGAKHRIANPGATTLEFIEVQTGTYFGEDDIVRYEDSYGRTSDSKHV